MTGPAPRSERVSMAALAQARAAWPGWSAWVAANAGSGKTRVLTGRVARLLLGGAAPQRILCLTFTKAAAAEMTNRLTETLGAWALMEDEALRDALADLAANEDAPALDAAALARARTLFAQALETPGGLKIQTIHAFCDAVLRRFPLEAGVSPDFTVIDDALRATLAAEARDRLAEAAAAGRDDAFDVVAEHLSEEGLDGLIGDILGKRALFAAARPPERVAAAFGLSPADLDDAPMARAFDGFDRALIAEAAAILCESGPGDGRVGLPLRDALACEGPALAAALGAAFRTSKGEPRDLSKCPTKKLAAEHPWLGDLICALGAQALDLIERDCAIAACRRALALNRFADAFLAAYAAEKRRRGALDYDDLIEGAARLFERSDMAAWALYKLDGGVDHVLVDEAQDTAPAQWAVIEALTAEFHAGEGARGPGRTIFVVGDEKQSIYSFQGAEPGIFAEKRAAFAARAEAAGAGFGHTLTLTTSFRSSPAILRAVDRTFALAPEGLTAGGAPPEHVAAHEDRPGRVDLWPLIPKPEKAEDPPWTAPVDAPPPTDPKLRLARIVAAEIARWVAEGERLPGGGRPIRPGDVMVLVRRRDRLAAEIVRRLKQAGVPVAGADRLKLTEDLAVRDLLALARFALTPGDDLTLAALLRSPLCSLSERDLFDVAHHREGESLWNAFRSARVRFPEAYGFLARMRGRTDYLRPYEFLETALIGEDGRRRLLARLGTEAEDPIDELLAQALAYERAEAPTLEGFLAWLERGAVEIKREMDKGAGEVRVMTVHGAKGLEAPVVILPDTIAKLGGRRGALARLADAEGPLPAWTAPADATPAALAEAKAEAERLEREESRRLLYVAMTRAERWLVICGAGEAKGETWRGLAEAGLRDAGAVETPPPAGLDGIALRLEDATGTAAPAEGAPPPAPPAAAPDWARRMPPPPPSSPRRRTASDLGGEAPPPAAPGPRDAETARRRGEAIHALLEILPDEPTADRAARAAALLAESLPDLPEADRAAAAAEALAALALPEAAPVFAPEALAEAALSADLPRIGRVAGRVDRLALTPDILAVDFKTDAQPPASPERTPEPYLRQMAAYREALRALHPGRPVAVGLLWTAIPRLDSLPDALLDAALARIPAAV